MTARLRAILSSQDDTRLITEVDLSSCTCACAVYSRILRTCALERSLRDSVLHVERGVM